MLGETDLNKLDEISNKYNQFKTILSTDGASGSNSTSTSAYQSSSLGSSSFSDTLDINSVEDKFGKLLNPDISSFNLSEDALIKKTVSEFSSAISGMGSLNINVNNSNIKNKKKSGGLLEDLINLIKGIVEMPIRFANLFKAFTLGTGALVLGIGGLGKSIALGTKDIYFLFVAIMTIVFKYSLCVVSFTITTIGGCIFVHIITLFFMILYIGIMYIADKINEYFGVDFSSTIDELVQPVKWPSAINSFCYSCFGKKVKLRDILADVGAVEYAGNMIYYDFNNKMPRYMKPGVPLGKSALNSLNKAIN